MIFSFFSFHTSFAQSGMNSDRSVNSFGSTQVDSFERTQFEYVSEETPPEQTQEERKWYEKLSDGVRTISTNIAGLFRRVFNPGYDDLDAGNGNQPSPEDTQEEPTPPPVVEEAPEEDFSQEQEESNDLNSDEDTGRSSIPEETVSEESPSPAVEQATEPEEDITPLPVVEENNEEPDPTPVTEDTQETNNLEDQDEEEEEDSKKSSGGSSGSNSVRSLATETVSLYAGGTGTVADPYLITSAQQFQDINQNLDAHFRLENDIDFTGFDLEPIGDALVMDLFGTVVAQSANRNNNILTYNYASAEDFFEVGDTFYSSESTDLVHVVDAGDGYISIHNPGSNGDVTNVFPHLGEAFTGTFDGNNKTLSNITMSRTDYSLVGIFGHTLGATISDLTIEDASISLDVSSGNVETASAAVLVGAALKHPVTEEYTTIDNVTLDGGTLTVTGSLTDGIVTRVASVAASGKPEAILNNFSSTVDITATDARDVFGITSEPHALSGVYYGGDIAISVDEFEDLGNASGGFWGLEGAFGGTEHVFARVHADANITITSRSGDTTWEAPGFTGIGGVTAVIGHGDDFDDILSTTTINMDIETAPSTASHGGGASSYRLGGLSGDYPVWWDASSDLAAVDNAVIATTFNLGSGYPETSHGVIGLSRYDENVGFTNTYFNTTTTGMTEPSFNLDITDPTGQNDAWFKTASNWSFLDTDVWSVTDGSYPCLIGVTPSCT